VKGSPDWDRAARSIKSTLTTMEFNLLTPKEYQLAERFYVLGLRAARGSIRRSQSDTAAEPR
jgi:hypothetical protein